MLVRGAGSAGGGDAARRGADGVAVDGDPDAAAVAAYPSLLGYAWLLTGSRTHAEDVVHEALVRCLRRARKAPIHEFVAYARRAVLNEVYRDARRRSWERSLDAVAMEMGRADGVRQAGGSIWPAVSGDRSDAVLDTVVDQAELRSWLARLPIRQRAAVVCRYYLDMTERDTAELLGCSVPAVKSLCHRGMALLRDESGTPDDPGRRATESAPAAPGAADNTRRTVGDPGARRNEGATEGALRKR